VPAEPVGYHPRALSNGRFSVGAWRSLVARIVRDDEVGGSNPLAPTKPNSQIKLLWDHVCQAMGTDRRAQPEGRLPEPIDLDAIEERVGEPAAARPALSPNHSEIAGGRPPTSGQWAAKWQATAANASLGSQSMSG
jgi:hypothetical protein